MKSINNLVWITYSLLILWAVGVFTWGYVSFDDQSSRSIKLTQIYGLSAITSLFLTHFIYSLSNLYTHVKSKYFVLLKPFIFATFLYALLHSVHAFFFNLGGFEGLAFLSEKYILAIILGDITLTSIFLFTIGLHEYFVNKFKLLESKIVEIIFYIGSFAVLIHILMLGSHFAVLSDLIPRIFYFSLISLLFIESIRLDNFLRPKMRVYPSFGFVLPLFIFVAGFLGNYVFEKNIRNGNTSLGIHAQHIKIAEEASKNTNVIGSKGDPTKRYRVDINQNINGLDGKFEFIVYDASNGAPAILFEDIYEKKMHLIIVDSTLEYYDHIHPEYVGEGRFVINTVFPQNGRYYMYADFQPLGAIEQQYGFQINVGKNEISRQVAIQQIDSNYEKKFGNYTVTLSGEKNWTASAMSLGKQRMIFTFKENGKDVNNLKPYLGAFGHLVMINQKTYQYIHVHPMGLPPVAPDEERGPSVEFSPIGLYGQIPKGIYRVFGQFNPDDKLMTVDFTIEVK